MSPAMSQAQGGGGGGCSRNALPRRAPGLHKHMPDTPHCGHHRLQSRWWRCERCARRRSPFFSLRRRLLLALIVLHGTWHGALVLHAWRVVSALRARLFAAVLAGAGTLESLRDSGATHRAPPLQRCTAAACGEWGMRCVVVECCVLRHTVVVVPVCMHIHI